MLKRNLNLFQNTISDPIRFRNLTLFAIKNSTENPIKYRYLDNSKIDNLVIEEKESASVGYIQISNKNNFPIFICDGQELIGAMQNRILDYSILIPENTDKPIEVPVSCVEQNRWGYTHTRHFKDADYVLFHKARHQKMCEVNENKKTDQHNLWDNIERKQSAMGSSSTTDSMDGIYNYNSKLLDQYKKAFAVEKSDVGFIYAINGKIVGLDLFNHQTTFKYYFSKILLGLALDCLELDVSNVEIQKDTALKFFEQVLHTSFDAWISFNNCKIYRSESNLVTGNALMDNIGVIHLAVFPKHLNY